MGRANDMRGVARKAGVSLAVVLAAGLGTVPLSPVFAAETGSEIAADAQTGDEATDKDVAKVGSDTFDNLQDAVNAALKDGNSGTVYLLDDITLTQCINVPKDAKLYINGNRKTITLNSQGGLPAFGNTDVSTNGIFGATQLTIHGVNFVTPSTLSDGNVSQQNYAVLVSGKADGVQVTLEKCSFTNMHDAVYCNAVQDTGALSNKIDINDSTFSNVAYAYGVDDAATAGALVDKHSFTLDGCTVDAAFGEAETFAVTAVDGVGYDDLQSAVAAVADKSGKIITLRKDVELDKMLDINVEDVTLYLDGHTIAASDDFAGTYDNDKHLVNVSADGVMITDGTLMAGEGNKHVLNVYGADDVTLQNVTLDHTDAGISGAPLVVNGSKVTVYGGLTTVTGENSWYAINVDSKQINGTNESSEFIVSDGAALCMDGEKPKYNAGIFVQNSVSADGTSSKVSFVNGSTIRSAITSDGFVAAAKSGQDTFIEMPENSGLVDAGNGFYYEAVASVTNGDEVTSYVSFAAAVNAAQENGGTVSLLKDVTVDKAIDINKNIAINGNGHTVTADGCPGFYIKANLDKLAISNLTLRGTLDEGETAGEGADGSWMGIGTYNGCYGVGDLDLDSVTIEGFSYGMYFGQNPDGTSSTFNDNPVRVHADELTIKDCYIKGAYFEKLTDSTFTDCSFLNNGDDEDAVQNTFQEWMCGVDINLKAGSYKDIVFDGCKFEGNGSNSGTALHIKARDDGNYETNAAMLDGVIVTDCVFTDNNDPDEEDGINTPVIIGEPNKDNKTPSNVTITGDVAFKNNLAGKNQAFHSVTFKSDGTVISTMSANGEITLPAAPTKDGYTFCGWSDGVKTFNAGETIPITGDTTFTAQWKRNSTPGGGSGGGTVSKPSYDITVSESENGAVNVTPKSAKAGEKVTISATPFEGFEVSGVAVADKDGKAVEVTENADGTWTFTMPKGDATVSVSFVCDGGELCPTAGLADVDQTQWYHLAVDWAVENGVMSGYEGTDLFGPEDVLTRAQLAQMLYNEAGRPEADASEAPVFSDVADGSWYSDAVEWAASEGLITGYEGSDAFGPDDVLTREQLAVVFWRIAGKPAAETDLSEFPDGADTAAWAEDAMEWAVSTGLLQGYDDTGRLDPAGDITRAQAATVFMRRADAE